jgi:holo-[acyl-carrier protein] synthase
MRIIGIGTDIVECLRIARMIDRHHETFLVRVFTEHEIRYCRTRKNCTEHFAARWAAKEAVLKSLGTGMIKGMCWTEIEIQNEPSGKPFVRLLGATREIAAGKRVGEILLSLSHCRAYAMAYAAALAADD